MKRIIYALVILAFASLVNAQWVQTSNGMGTGLWIWSLASYGNNIFAGTDADGVYFSSNNGANWTQTSTFIPAFPVHSLATDGNYVYAGTHQNGFFRSTNNGTVWYQSLYPHRVNAILIDGANVFAGVQDSGIYLSTNNGVNWTKTSMFNRSVNTIVKSGGNLIAGTFENGIYCSTNYGTSWTSVALSGNIVYAITVSGSIVYASTYASSSNCIFRSTNNGLNWIGLELYSVNVRSLAASGNNLFAGANTVGCWFSSDGGMSWVPKSAGFSGTNLIGQAMIVKDNYVFAGMYYKSVYRHIINGTPTKVILNSPSNNAQNQPQNITFKWFKAVDRLMQDSIDSPFEITAVSNYWLEYSLDSTFTTGVIRDSTLTDTTKNVSGLNAGAKYFWRVKAKNQTGWNNFSVVWNFRITITGIVALNEELPDKFKLFNNYPNPFNPTTKIKFSIVSSPHFLGGVPVKLKVYDAMGREVQTLVNERLQPGTYETSFDGSKLTSGVYFYKISVLHGGSSTVDFIDTKKMLMIK